MIRDQTKIYWEVIQEPTQTGAVRVVESPGPGGEQPNVCLVNYDKFCQTGTIIERQETRLKTAKLIAAAPEMFRYLNNYKEFIERCCLTGASGCSDCQEAGTCDYHAVTQIIERIGTHS